MPDETPVEKPKRTPRKRAAVDPQARLAELKEKYRLTDQVKINAKGSNGRPLGRGPLLDDNVFNRLAELDTTPEKKYLDWMLFQCGGGPKAVAASMATWGEGLKPLEPAEILERWKRSAKGNARLTSKDVEYVADNILELPQVKPIAAQLITAAIQPPEEKDKLAAVVQVLKQHHIAPGKEEKVGVALLSYNVKVFVRNQPDVKARDRIHATLAYTQMLLGRSMEEFENDWKGGLEMRKKREYCFADEDSVQYGWFAFSRHWPGKEGKYEKVYNEMKQFLINTARVQERMAKLDQWNAAIEAKNATLPPEQAIPLREPIDVNLDIGTVTLTKTLELVYKGDYKTLADLTAVNNGIEELPLRERIRGHVSYAGPKGRTGRSEKLYSDQYVDVLVPLTVAASIKAGYEKWRMSRADQLNDLKQHGYNSSAWASAHRDRHGETTANAVTLFFILKHPDVPEEYRKLRLTVPISELADTDLNHMSRFTVDFKWVASTEHENEVGFKDLVNGIKASMPPASATPQINSLMKAVKAVCDWGKEFDPRHIVPDFIAHHRERNATKRGLREHMVFRVNQVIDALIEA